MKERSKPQKKKSRGSWRGAGGDLGGALGLAFGPTGAIAGRSLGSAAERIISHIVGHGAYSISKNSLLVEPTVASFANGAEGIRVKHREFIANVTGSTLFTIHKYIVNPGDGTLFPWFHQVARNFEFYQLEGLIFEYRPTSGSIAGASPALGTVVLAPRFDVVEPDFANKVEMEAAEFATSIVPSATGIMPVECAHKSKMLGQFKVRQSSATPTDPLQFYDYCNVYLATIGMQSAYDVGELWVSYDVLLTKPHFQRAAINPGPTPDDVYDAAHSYVATGVHETALLEGMVVDTYYPGWGIGMNHDNEYWVTPPLNHDALFVIRLTGNFTQIGALIHSVPNDISDYASWYFNSSATGSSLTGTSITAQIRCRASAATARFTLGVTAGTFEGICEILYIDYGALAAPSPPGGDSSTLMINMNAMLKRLEALEIKARPVTDDCVSSHSGVLPFRGRK